MTTSVEYLPAAIRLAGDLVAKIDLTPMPLPEANGRYKLRQDCEIAVSLLRDSVLIERRPWHTLICEDVTVELADGTVLGEDDLHDLDSEGWRVMMKFGLIPGAFIP